MEDNKLNTNVGEDLHIAKASHMSVPIASGVELHLNPRDAQRDAVEGQVYDIVIPMVLTSKDEGGYRFKQSGMVEMRDRNPEAAGNAEQKVAPMHLYSFFKGK